MRTTTQRPGGTGGRLPASAEAVTGSDRSSATRAFVQRRGARLLGTIGTADAVPLLQPLLRQSDPRVARAAVAALGVIPDPAAARAIHTVLRAATGEVRRAVTEALVSERDPRVVPMLVRILEESEPLGKDHEVALEAIEALGTVGTDASVPILVTMAQRKRFLGGRKLRALKERSVDALVRVKTETSVPRRTPPNRAMATSGKSPGRSSDGRSEARSDPAARRRCSSTSSTRRRTRSSSAASTH